MPTYRIDDDDDYPPLSRQDIVMLRELLIKIEEAGGIDLLNTNDIHILRAVASLMGKPGIPEAIEAIAEGYRVSIIWQKMRLKVYRATGWMLAGFSSLLGLVLAFDQAAKAVREWFR